MTSYFAPLHADSAEVLALDMQSLFLTGRILPFGAQLTVAHVFRSSEKTPVEVVYCFPLPRDASLVSFKISGDRFSIASRLEPIADALARYEAAMEKGSLAALTQQNADGMVNLTVGNLRPGETVSVCLDLIAGLSLKDDGFRLRFPFTAAPCYHSQMRVSVDSSSAGTLELPDAVTGGVFLPPFHNDASSLHTIGFDLRIEPKDIVGEVASPSHAVRLRLHDLIAYLSYRFVGRHRVPHFYEYLLQRARIRWGQINKRRRDDRIVDVDRFSGNIIVEPAARNSEDDHCAHYPSNYFISF